MQQMVGIGHDADMPFPEDEIASAQSVRRAPVRNVISGPGKLHVTVARQYHTHRLEGLLGQPGAIEPEALPSAPQIWRAEKTLCHHDRVIFQKLHRNDMARVHPSAAIRIKPVTFPPADRQTRAMAQQEARGRFEIRFAVTMCLG